MNEDFKKILRKQVLAARKILPGSVWEERNKLIQASTIDFVIKSSAKVIHSFLPIERNKEVDTWPIVKEMMKLERKVVISITDLNRETMHHYYYNPQLKFRLNRLRIPEPVDAEVADIKTIDLVLVPLIAADKQGNRIGYGKGYYDKLLDQIPGVKKVGLSLGSLFDAFSFSEPHDIRLDHCISPFEIYHTT